MTAITDLSEVIWVLASALGYPDGPPKPHVSSRRPYRWPDDITAPCGTEAACRRHLRHGETPDFACRHAAARAKAERKARRQEGSPA
jgi:hypothetical protein